MSIIDKVKTLIADSHATGYGSELPASVTRLFDELAGEIERFVPAAAAPLAGIEQLATTLRDEFAEAIAAAVTKAEQDFAAKLEAAETAIGARLADVFKAWAAKQGGDPAAVQAAPQPAPAVPAAPAAPAADPAPAPQGPAAPG